MTLDNRGESHLNERESFLEQRIQVLLKERDSLAQENLDLRQQIFLLERSVENIISGE